MIKKIINYILLILVFSFFVGCSSKQANVLDNHTDQISLSKQINTDKAQEEDDEDDEINFDDDDSNSTDSHESDTDDSETEGETPPVD